MSFVLKRRPRQQQQLRAFSTTVARHVPILADSIVELFASVPQPSTSRRRRVFVDCTFGDGGHTQLLLERIPDSDVVCIDADEEAFERPHALALRAAFASRVEFHVSPFSQLATLLQRSKLVEQRSQNLADTIDNNAPLVDGVLLDVGFCSSQVDDAARGLSFMRDGPLDMRYSRRGAQQTAADIVNSYSVEQLTHLFLKFGEIRVSLLYFF